MTSTVREPTSRANSRAAREAAVSMTRRPSGPVRRRWGRVGGGVGSAVVGAWLFSALYLSAGDRHDVLVVARDVGRLEVIERGDLRSVRISSDTDVASIDASRMDDFVGRVAAVDLLPGSLLAERQVIAEGRQLLDDDGLVVVGLLLGPRDAPMQSIQRGATVLVVIRPPSGSEDDVEQVEAWVFDASAEPLNTREQPVEFAVPRPDAGRIAAAAADGRVSIVATEA